MEKVFDQDTIAAIATPVGEGAIAVIRVSGPDAITAVDRVFRGRIKLTNASSFSVHFGRLTNLRGEIVDEVMASVFRKPSSYTGENTVELSCHGGYYITQKVFDTILSTGVREAKPGEFTKRAFLNGKMDLSQAEAVASLIAAKSESSYKASMYQLEGRFSHEIKALRSELLDLSSLLEVDLDFSEEGIPLISKAEIIRLIQNLKRNLESMISTYETGKRYREGVSVAIVGKPNAGKSSLFNALLAQDRAIVSETAGTTRDSLEESILINCVLFRLHDTAGLRNSSDPVEAEGVSRSRKLMQQSDITLLVVDLSDPEAMDISIIDGFESAQIIVLNKSDLVEADRRKPVSSASETVIVSARNREGLEELRSKLYSAMFANEIGIERAQVTSARHYSLLTKATQFLQQAETSSGNGVSNEFVSTDIVAASGCLSEIIGEMSSEDTLNNIFAHFCIGK